MTISPDTYEIIPYRPEFRRDLLELQQHMWGPDLERNAAHFHWKYGSNPYTNLSFVRLAVYEGKAVGMVALVPAEWEAGQPPQSFECLTHADGVIHPDHRRRGLYERMTKALLDDAAQHDFEYIIALSANPATAAGNLKLGWHSAGSLETASWHVDRQKQATLRALAARLPLLRQAYRRLRRQAPEGPASSGGQYLPFDALDKWAAASGTTGSRISVGTVPRPEAMAELVERRGSDGRIRHSRDERFLAWRFGNPLSVYRFLFWDDARLEGYLVLQAPVDAADDYWIHIVDWEATGLQIRTELLEAALKHSSSQVLVIWSATLPDEVKTLLKSHGFHFSSNTTAAEGEVWQPHVLVRPVRDIPLTDWKLAGRNLLDLADWDLRAIYSDNF